MAGKQYEVAFAIGAKLQGQFGSAFKNAQTSVTSLQNKIESLQRKQGDISAYQKQQQAVEQTRAKLEYLNKEYELLKGQMGENGEASASLQTAMMRKQLQIDRTTASLEGQEKKLGSLGNALTDAGVDTTNLAKESQSLAAELDSVKSQQEEVAAASQHMGQSMGEAASSMEQLLVAAGLTAALKAAYDLLEQCADASIDFESGMAGVQRTVGGSQAFLSSLGEDFKEMSTVIPITTESLTGIATTAGQLGVAQKNVESFTTVMAQLDTTTDLTAESAATMLAQFSNITGVTQYDRLGSVVADLGDATATTASKVVEMSQGMAAAAHLAGMGATDILGISAATGSLGVEAQAGSTAMSTLINTLYKAVETGDGLNKFASVANMSAEQFKQAWGENAAGALNSFIQGLNDTERNGKSAIVILDELGINNVRQTKAILGLASAGNLLSNTISQANAAWEKNTALTEKASVMYGTTSAKLTMAQNAANNLKIAIGDALTPTIGAGAAGFTAFVQPIAVFIQKNPALIKAFVSAGTVIGTVTVAITGYAAAAKLAAAASALFTSTIPGLNIILFATAAIAGLTAGVVLLADAFKSSQESMEELDSEFDDLNADFRKQSHIRSLCAEYKQLQGELLNTKNSFNGLEDQDNITVTISASALATLIPEDFMNPDAEGIKLTAEQIANLVASGFMLEGDEGIVLTAKQTADLVASGFLDPDDKGILLKAGQVAELVSSGFMKPDDEGITLKAGQTADLLAKGFLNPEDEGITLSAEQTQVLLASGFLSPDDEGITLTAEQKADLMSRGFLNPDDEGIEIQARQVADLTSAGFMLAGDEGITISAKQTADLLSKGFLNPDDDGITLKAAQTADLLASGFLSEDDKGITLKAGQTADLLAKGFLNADDPGISLKAGQVADLYTKGFLAEDDQGITLTAEQTANLVAAGFMNDDDEGIILAAKQTADLLSSGFLKSDDPGITLSAKQTAELEASGFLKPDDEGIVLTARQTAELVASGFLNPDDEGITVSAIQSATLVSSGFLSPDDNGITLTAKQTADLLSQGFISPDDKGITLSAEQTNNLLASGFLSPDDQGILLEAAQKANLLSEGFLSETDDGITLTAQQTADLVAAGFLNPDDEGITLKAGQTADLFAAGFLSQDDEGIILKAGQTADLLAAGFLKEDDDGITLKASQTADLAAAGFMIDPNEQIPISGSAVKDLEAKGFLKGTDIIEIKGKADTTSKITVDDYIAATDRVVELTANVSNLEEVQQAISSLQTEADTLKDKAATAKNDLTSAQTALADMETRQGALEARLTHAGTPAAKSEIQTAIEAQTDAVEAQRAKVAELEGAYTSAATQYTLTQAAADELAAKEKRLTEIKAELADETNGVVSAIEKETAAIAAQIEQADAMAVIDQAKTRSEIYKNITEQAKLYAKTVKESEEYAKSIAPTLETANNAQKYLAMSAEEVAKTYADMLEDLDYSRGDLELKADPEFLELLNAAADIYGLWHAGDGMFEGMGKSAREFFAEWADSADKNFSFAKDLQLDFAPEHWEQSLESLNKALVEYGAYTEEAQQTTDAFIQDLVDGVSYGAVSVEEVNARLTDALASVAGGSEIVQQIMAQVNAELEGAAESSEHMADGLSEIGLSAAEVNAAIQPILDQMAALGDAYQEAYDEAYKSMDGQFKLFEEAPKLTEESVDKMIVSLESQAAYMREYSSNLKAAGEMGLSEGLLAQLSDGSKESAAYLAAIVKDGATKIDELNTAFASVEEGKDTFADTVASMQTDFSAQMDQLTIELAQTVAEMDMSTDAAQAGADTVQAFADAASGKTDAVIAAFRSISKAAKLALGVDLNPEGYATGTESAERGFKMVGENGPEIVWFNGGEKVMNAQETAAFQRESAIAAEPVNALSSSGSGNGGHHIEVKPIYNLSGGMDTTEVRSILDEQTARIKELVEDVLEEIDSDRERMAYSP